MKGKKRKVIKTVKKRRAKKVKRGIKIHTWKIVKNGIGRTRSGKKSRKKAGKKREKVGKKQKSRKKQKRVGKNIL
jgi:hypothetical protein